MAEAIKDVVIRISAQQSGFETFSKAALNIEDLSQSVQKANIGNFSQEIQEAQAHAGNFGTGLKEADIAAASFSERLSRSAAGMEKVGHFGATMLNIFDRIEISQLNVANAQMMVTNAQIRLNEATERYGKNSTEAVVAANALERSQNNLSKSTNRANDSMILVGVTLIGQIPAVISFGKTMITTLKGVEFSAASMSLRLKALAPELLVLSALAGGFYYLTQQAKSSEEAMTAAFDTINPKADELRRTLDDIRNNLVGFENRMAETQLKLTATQKAIAESGLSEDERRKQNAEAILRFNQEVRDIQLDADKAALKTSTDQEAIYAHMGQIMEANAVAELSRQKEINEFRGLRGSLAGPSAIGSTIPGGAMPTPIAATISPFLSQAQAATQKKLDVNVAEWSAKEPIPIQQGPGLGAQAMTGAAGLFGFVEATRIATGKTPLAVQMGEMLASVKALVPTTAGIPFLPASPFFQQAMKDLNITVSMDPQQTQQFLSGQYVRNTGAGISH